MDMVTDFIREHLSDFLKFTKLLLYSLLAAGIRVVFNPPKTFKEKAVMYFGGVLVGLVVGRVCNEMKIDNGLSYAISSFSAISWKEVVEFLITSAKNPIKFFQDYLTFMTSKKTEEKTEDKSEPK
jgi:hypothetical protein